MSQVPTRAEAEPSGPGLLRILLKVCLFWPLWLLSWPFLFTVRQLWERYLSYILGWVDYDEEGNVKQIRFIWYPSLIFYHPMIWGSFLLAALVQREAISSGWAALALVMCVGVTVITVQLDMNIRRLIILLLVLAVLGLSARLSTVQWHFNLAFHIRNYFVGLNVTASWTLFLVFGYLFLGITSGAVIYAWLNRRVGMDSAEIREHTFMRRTVRTPYYMRETVREIKDVLELLTTGSADVSVRTSRGMKTFQNIPRMGWGLGRALDRLTDQSGDLTTARAKQQAMHDAANLVAQAATHDHENHSDVAHSEADGDSNATVTDADSGHGR